MPEPVRLTRLRALLYPELSAIPPHLRDQELARARRAPFDLVEWLGLLAGVAATVALTRYAPAGLSLPGRAGAALANYSQAVLLLTLLVGPFLLRRTRRGLRAGCSGSAPPSPPL